MKRKEESRPIDTQKLPHVVSQYEGTDAEFDGEREEGDGNASVFRNELLDMRSRNLARRKRA